MRPLPLAIASAPAAFSSCFTLRQLRCATACTHHLARHFSSAVPPREPVLQRLRNTFHPWGEVCKVTEPNELHTNLNAFASTTGIIGSLLLSLTGAAMLADPPSYSARAHEKQEQQQAPQIENGKIAQTTWWQLRRRKAGQLLLKSFGADFESWEDWTKEHRDDAYYMLLATSFFCSVKTVLTSTMVITNLQAIPNAYTLRFVQRHGLWITLPAVLIAPTAACFTTAICIGLESEFGSRVSDTAWALNLLLLGSSSYCVLSMLNHNHQVRRAILFERVSRSVATRG